MKFGVVVFPGTHGDQDISYVLEEVMGQQVERIWYQDGVLTGFRAQDCLVLPGGAAYGDYLRPGALTRLAPIVPALKKFSASGGYIFGIGNGFQILCELGLLPGVLLLNESDAFVSNNVWLKTITSNSPITAGINPDEVIKLPVAHRYGRYFVDTVTLKEMERNDQILFRYCDREGKLTQKSNPNGALSNIAGICNADRNVFALMPRPERAAERELGNTDGRYLFESLIRTAKIDDTK